MNNAGCIQRLVCMYVCVYNKGELKFSNGRDMGGIRLMTASDRINGNAILIHELLNKPNQPSY